MGIKFTIQGYLIYATIAAYLLSFLLSVFRQKKIGQVTFFIGFLLGITGFAYRWYDAGHVPFQNMFEVFLSMGMLIYPLSIFCRRVLKVGGVTADMLLGVLLLFPAGFVNKFSAEPQELPPALQCWLFIPHVAVYLISYVIMAKAAVQAGARLIGSKPQPDSGLVDGEMGAYRMVCLGFPVLTLGLILGSWWGKLAWGDYWGWDPKELWSLVSWLVYLGYFHFRYMFGRKIPRANSVWVLTGIVAILITLLWVNLSKLFPGLHSYA
jgi:ABC-type transport system involved in cytochrome c biogenesis permease subunit